MANKYATNKIKYVSSINDLYGSNSNQGDIAIESLTGKTYVSTGTSWNTILPIATSNDVEISVDGIVKKVDNDKQYNIIEKYFKTTILLGKFYNYDKELNKKEFLDLIKTYIEKETHRENCYCSFNKDALLESISITFDFNNSFVVDNENNLPIDTYLYFNDIFYINTEKFLSIVKKAAFDCLLKVDM